MPRTIELTTRLRMPHSTALVLIACSFVILTCAGCSASPQARTASAEVTAAIEALAEAQDEVRLLYLERLEETRWTIVDAIVAAHVAERIGNLSQTEPEADLIRVAEILRGERQRVRANLTRVMAIEAFPEEEPAILLEELASEVSEELRALAETLPGEHGDSLRKQADSRSSPFHLMLRQHAPDIENIVRLSATRTLVAEGFHDLRLYLDFLASIERQLHLWLHAGAEVGGADLARFVDENIPLLGRRRATGGTTP